jgi:phosphate transport system substrate-binding protein
MRKTIGVLAVLILFIVYGCAASAGGSAAPSIHLVSREEGSGTRSAFTSLFGVLDAQKTDATSLASEVTNSTSVMLFSIQNDPSAIGYLSLGSLNNMVKPLRIEGVYPSQDGVRSGAYPIARPFLVATRGELSATARDFLAFIQSDDGQVIVEENGYVQIEETAPYAAGDVSGKVVLAGSSSVAPVMEALAEAYQDRQTDVRIEVQQSDSSTGMSATIDGICDIGMTSRELTQSEIDKGLTSTVIARDGIVVVVCPENPVDGLSIAQVRVIFLGEVKSWEEALNG